MIMLCEARAARARRRFLSECLLNDLWAPVVTGLPHDRPRVVPVEMNERGPRDPDV